MRRLLLAGLLLVPALAMAQPTLPLVAMTNWNLWKI